MSDEELQALRAELQQMRETTARIASAPSEAVIRALKEFVQGELRGSAEDE